MKPNDNEPYNLFGFPTRLNPTYFTILVLCSVFSQRLSRAQSAAHYSKGCDEMLFHWLIPAELYRQFARTNICTELPPLSSKVTTYSPTAEPALK